MASLQHPFQCLQYAKRNSHGLPNLLIAAAGRHLYSYDATSGQRLDVWPQDVESTAEPVPGTVSATEGGAPPEKRRKLSPASEGQQEQKPAGKKPLTGTTIPLLVTSPDGKYVIATTGDGKTIRVFELNDDGKLKELSSRMMPKRPSALALTPDGQTILCGDKFGDVYSLPLIPGEYVRRIVEQPAIPSATLLTVHTKGNLRTLEMQRLHAEKKAQTAKQETAALNFEHHNIIGHVSVLSDLISVSVSGRSYILTGDRDEHIRVSRGIPQAHVIEQFCLGHTSLVSKLCVPSWAPHLLVSGDTDGNLFVWDWRNAEIHQNISLEQSLQSEAMVRGIWDVSLEQSGASGPVNVILVSLEGSSQLLCYTIENNALRAQDSIQLSGNVLGLIGIDSRGTVVVSVDTVRDAGSIDNWKSSSGALLESFQINRGPDGLKCVRSEDTMVANINSIGTSDLPAGLNEKQQKEFNDSLYNLGNMKKKHYEE
ncbi:hypothetical protein N7451_003248 [Penicillium sp. IBT 35674x]|nr:hypothetical protein N7451_003248 [Penicillium sp. IBT 35674x]